jgi:hypothetical protein
MRSRFLRWSKHQCRELPKTTTVIYDLPCRCGWHITGTLQADSETTLLLRIGAPVRRHDLTGPLTMLLDHYDTCPERTS